MSYFLQLPDGSGLDVRKISTWCTSRYADGQTTLNVVMDNGTEAHFSEAAAVIVRQAIKSTDWPFISRLSFLENTELHAVIRAALDQLIARYTHASNKTAAHQVRKALTDLRRNGILPTENEED